MKTDVESPADKAALSPTERKRRRELERIIERGFKSWLRVSEALLEMRDSRLYRETHETFEEYARDRWGLARRTAYGYIEAATVSANVSASAQLPSVQHARELAVLPPAEQRELAPKVAAVPVREARRLVREHRQSHQLDKTLHEQARASRSDGEQVHEDDFSKAHHQAVLICARLRSQVIEPMQEAHAAGASAEGGQRASLLAALDEISKLVNYGRSYVAQEAVPSSSRTRTRTPRRAAAPPTPARRRGTPSA